VAEPVEPVATEPVEPVAEPVEPVAEPVEPVAEPVEPVAEPVVEPAAEPVEPVVAKEDEERVPEVQQQEEVDLDFGENDPNAPWNHMEKNPLDTEEFSNISLDTLDEEMKARLDQAEVPDDLKNFKFNVSDPEGMKPPAIEVASMAPAPAPAPAPAVAASPVAAAVEPGLPEPVAAEPVATAAEPMVTEPAAQPAPGQLTDAELAAEESMKEEPTYEMANAEMKAEPSFEMAEPQSEPSYEAKEEAEPSSTYDPSVAYELAMDEMTPDAPAQSAAVNSHK